jgi:putative flippase GtrA
MYSLKEGIVGFTLAVVQIALCIGIVLAWTWCASTGEAIGWTVGLAVAFSGINDRLTWGAW